MLTILVQIGIHPTRMKKHVVSKASFVVLTSMLATACKSQVREITLVAPMGTTLEYRLEPAGPTGTVTIRKELRDGIGQEVVSFPDKTEAEDVAIVAEHPQKAQQGSPDLKAIILPSATESQKGFRPADVNTSIRLKNRAQEPNGFEQAKCDNLIEAKGAEGKLTVKVAAPLSPGDCDDQKLRIEDPLWAGRGRGVDQHMNYFSPADDDRLGAQFVQEFNTKNRHLLVQDSVALPYLQNLMNRIAASSDAPHIRPKVHLINADVINAFALPGGYVYVFRGIMERISSEAELVGILGHEWGHVAARHGTRNMTKALNTQMALFSLILATEVAAKTQKDERARAKAELVAKITQIAATVGGNLMLLAGSREVEAEADTLGAEYAYRTGYAPDGIGTFFNALAASSGNATNIEALLSDHPDHLSRVSSNASKIDAYFPLDALQLPHQTASFDQARRSLGNLPGMVTGKAANEVLGLQFVETNREVAKKEMSRYLGDLAGE